MDFGCFIIYYVNGCFGVTALFGCFNFLKATFNFNLTRKESFLETTLQGEIFYTYLVLHKLFIKHQLCINNPKRFLTKMINLLTLCFYQFTVLNNSVLFSKWFSHSLIFTFSFAFFSSFNYLLISVVHVKIFVTCLIHTLSRTLWNTTEILGRI